MDVEYNVFFFSIRGVYGNMYLTFIFNSFRNVCAWICFSLIYSYAVWDQTSIRCDFNHKKNGAVNRFRNNSTY
ncbi:uncharacterized protein H6S33_010483 [Morchella sextelata]|uniref:uncharacterized protein n=1 Tax=Morchella sextelata TaxID=1174677 RepID=UPI001D05957D|nr:uncharacterized protein H6S33_010483 [Morchella sextelata]KAH0612431.1 hypothetical protein H6S33_010483 [Morchella sextelata]